MYKLSPSDFGYLYNDCKHCYYQKVKYGITHSGAFPAMFGRINTLLQNSIMGKNLQDININLPSGIVSVQEGFMKSVPIPGAEDCFIQGRFDILVKMDDGTFNLIDFKITTPDEEKIQKYASQLHAYKFALENPGNGKEPIKISRLGVISVNPEEMSIKDNRIVFTAMPTWHEIQVNMDGFLSLIKEISLLLNGPVPNDSENCNLCKYRMYFLTPPTPSTEEIPF